LILTVRLPIRDERLSDYGARGPCGEEKRAEQIYVVEDEVCLSERRFFEAAIHRLGDCSCCNIV
jgi:hypothetical protein